MKPLSVAFSAQAVRSSKALISEGELTPDEASEFQGCVEANSALAGLFVAAKHLSAVLAMTHEIFHASATVEIEADAEIDESYILIAVIASGSVDDAVAMYHEWHKNLATVAPSDVSHYRLNMDVR